MLAHRLLRSARISPILGYRVVFGAPLNVGQRHRRRANINPALVQGYASPPLTRQYVSVLYISPEFLCVMENLENCNFTFQAWKTHGI